MNLEIQEWGMPSFNMLGAIDNGSGLWVNAYQNGTDIIRILTDIVSSLTPWFLHFLTPLKRVNLNLCATSALLTCWQIKMCWNLHPKKQYIRLRFRSK